ncbi:MAG TPA: hypothetical protein PK771_01170 [Spirochaetota bacterium]|nr:hypothetical protein [Spirochaetota bacterium]
MTELFSLFGSLLGALAGTFGAYYISVLSQKPRMKLELLSYPINSTNYLFVKISNLKSSTLNISRISVTIRYENKVQDLHENVFYPHDKIYGERNMCIRKSKSGDDTAIVNYYDIEGHNSFIFMVSRYNGLIFKDIISDESITAFLEAIDITGECYKKIYLKKRGKLKFTPI